MKRLIAILLCVVLLVPLAACGKKDEAEMQTSQVERRDLVDSVSATGTITGVEKEEVQTTLTGYGIETVCVEEGDRVAVGSLLCTLDVSAIEDSLATINASIAAGEEQNALSISAAQRQLSSTQQSTAIQQAGAQDNVNNMLSDRDKYAADYATAKQEYDEALADEKNKKAIFDKLDDSYHEIKDEYDKRTNAYNVAAAKAAVYQTQLQQAQADVTDAQISMSDSQSDISIYTADITSLSSEISVLESRIATLQNQINSAPEGSDTSALESQLDSAESQLKSKNNSLASRKRSLDVAQDRLSSAQSSLTSAQRKVNEVQKEYNTANATASDLAVKLREYELTYTKELSDWNEANSDYQEAKSERVTKENKKDSLETQNRNGERNYNSAKRDQSSTAISAAESVAGQQDNLRNAQINASSSLNSSYDQRRRYEDQLASGRLVANVPGVVTQVNVKEDSVYGGGVMLTIENNDAYEIETYVGEHQIGNIQEGMTVRIRTDATEDDVLQGVVTYVSPVPRTDSSGSSAAAAAASMSALSSSSVSSEDVEYLVRVSVSAEDTRLRLGMNARLSIELENREDALAVPYDAIQKDENGDSFIQLVQGDELKDVPVTVGITNANYAEILSGDIQEGDTVFVPEAESIEFSDMMDAMQGM